MSGGEYVFEQAQLRAPHWNREEPAPRRTCISRRLRHFLYAGGREHVVQPAPQRTLCISRDATSRQLHPSRCPLYQRTQFRYGSVGKWHSEPTTVSFTAFDPNAPAQYVQQWNTQLEKSFGGNTTLAVGYLGARGFHLQRTHLINNAPPGPARLDRGGPSRHLAS
jgi:hypothetical protein